jgi:predicted NAD/FAD-binding protein
LEEHQDGRVAVCNARGDGGLFDRAIVATQANQLDFLVGERFAAERALLAGIRYDSGHLVVHSDPRFLPARRADWTALHFQADRLEDPPMFTVWVNAVEPTIAGHAPVMQTWNPCVPPAADTVIASIPLQRAVVHTATARVLRELSVWHSSPDRRVFYCGSWAHEGVPLLETAVRSARTVVDHLTAQGVDPAR